MRRKNVLIIAVILILVCITSAAAAFLYINVTSDPHIGNSILVMLVDDGGEHEPSIGAADFEFVVQLNNNSDVTNLTPINPHGLYLPNATPAIEMHNVGINQLYLHDTLYDTDLATGAKHAQEIVEDDKGLKTDSVVIIKPQAVDAILTSIGGVTINGTLVTNNSISFLRQEQSVDNISRADAVESMGYAIKDAAKNSSKRSAMIQAITLQYAEGNIIVIPNNLFYKIITTTSMNKLFR
jgi:hypothetical protein